MLDKPILCRPNEMVIFHFKKSAYTRSARKFCSCFPYHSPWDSECSTLLSLPRKSSEIQQHFDHELSLPELSVLCTRQCHKGGCCHQWGCSHCTPASDILVWGHSASERGKYCNTRLARGEFSKQLQREKPNRGMKCFKRNAVAACLLRNLLRASNSDRALSVWCADPPTSKSVLNIWRLQLLSRHTEKGTQKRDAE